MIKKGKVDFKGDIFIISSKYLKRYQYYCQQETENAMMKKIITLFLFVLLIQFAGAALTDGVQLHAPLDGNANDISGNGNNGIVYGAVLTSDKDNNANSAYQFNGQNSYIDFGTSSLGLSDKITVSVWIKPNSQASYYSQIISPEAYYRPYMIRTAGRGPDLTAQCLISASTGGNYIEANKGGIKVGNWHHIACAYDGAKASIYVDGELKNSVSMSGPLRMRPQHILAGANPSIPISSFFNGTIDDIRIWNRGLSQDEIEELAE